MHTVQKSLNNILDTMSGADGGVSFIKLKFLLEDWERQAAQGDKPAQELCNVLHRFSNLVDVAKR